MRAERRKWFGGWPSIIGVFTVLTVAALSIWLVAGGSKTPRPDANNDMPIVPQPVTTTPSPTAPPVVAKSSSPSPSPSSSSSPPEKTQEPPPKSNPPQESSPALKASYGYSIDWFNNVDSEITLTNPGGKDVVGWTVVLVLPAGMTVERADGATFKVTKGNTVTFTPNGDDTVSAKDTYSFTFHGAAPRDGAPRPTSCTVNGAPC